MDIVRKAAVDTMKQFGMFVQNALPKNLEEQKELAKLEIKAEVDPKIWAEMSDYVNKMLDAAGAAKGSEGVKEMTRKLLDYAKEKQREFEDNENQAKAMAERGADTLQLSANVTLLIQQQMAAGAS